VRVFAVGQLDRFADAHPSNTGRVMPLCPVKGDHGTDVERAVKTKKWFDH
jgi:hypothetical protein